MSHEIILYDLASQAGKCWSLNPFKARLALNYKGLPYRTEWTEYPDLRPKFQALGIPPNSPEVNPNSQYSSPAIRLPDGSYIMDSLTIARALEKLQPEPSLHLDNGYTDRVQSVVLKIWGALGPIGMHRIPIRVLNPASQEYFLTTREKRFGMSLLERSKPENQGGEGAWERAQEGLGELREILGENGEGPFVMGKEVSFADFVIVGFFRCAEILDEGGDLFPRLMGFDGSFSKLYEACGKWLERDD